MRHHEILGVNQDANKDEILRAFRRTAKELHPDHNKSPEAAEAFTKLKEARDALLEDSANRRSKDTIQHSTASAVKATANAAYATQTTKPVMTDEEIAKIQELDHLAARKPRWSLFKRKKESAEVKRHRHRIKVNNRRIMGKY